MSYTIYTFVAVCVLTFALKKYKQDGPNKFRYELNYFLLFLTMFVAAFIMLPILICRPKNVLNSKYVGKSWDVVNRQLFIITNPPYCHIHVCRGYRWHYVGLAVNLMKPITKVIGIEWQLRNGEIIAEDRGAVIIANHQNTLDILGMFNIWNVIPKLTAIAKKQLLYAWPIGPCAYLAGVVFIDRSNAKSAYKQLQQTSKIIVKDKTKVWIYPEGTRNKDYTKLLPFKKGAFNIAVDAQVPIIPVVFSPYYFINSDKNIFNRGHVVIQCLEPVSTKGLTIEDVPKLIEQVHQKMSVAYKELSKEVLNALPVTLH